MHHKPKDGFHLFVGIVLICINALALEMAWEKKSRARFAVNQIQISKSPLLLLRCLFARFLPAA